MRTDTIEITRDPAVGDALARGYTLPAAWYTRDDVFELEQERIFHRTWQYVGYAEQVARPGDYLTCMLGHAPVIVARDLDGVLRAFANVCRHRGSTLVLDAAGCRKTIQCHYHGWTWNLDGTLRTAPRMNEQPDFNRDEFPLIPLPVETWGPLIFVNPDRQAAPLADTLGDLPRIFAGAGLDLGAVRHRQRREYDIAANWKVVAENYNECYHCPVAHPSFSDLFDVDGYSIATEHEWFTLARSGVRESAKGGADPRLYDVSDAVLEAGVREGCFALLFPHTTIEVNPGPQNLTVGYMIPLGVHRTMQIYDSFFAPEVDDAAAGDMIGFGSQVQAEDIVLCESVQRGLRSGYYQQGKLMVSRENGIQQFQRFIHRALSA